LFTKWFTQAEPGSRNVDECSQEEDYEIELRLILKLFAKQVTAATKADGELIMLCVAARAERFMTSEMNSIRRRVGGSLGRLSGSEVAGCCHFGLLALIPRVIALIIFYPPVDVCFAVNGDFMLTTPRETLSAQKSLKQLERSPAIN
jgi:hypothetical protein